MVAKCFECNDKHLLAIIRRILSVIEYKKGYNELINIRISSKSLKV